MTHLLLALALSVSHTPIPVDRVELNHKYDCTGELTLTQVIVWRPMHMERYESHVSDWRIVKDEPSRSRGECGSIVRFTHRGELIVLRARVYRETHTKADPEYADRRLLKEDDRMPQLGRCE